MRTVSYRLPDKPMRSDKTKTEMQVRGAPICASVYACPIMGALLIL